MEAFLDRLMQAHGCELPPKDDTSGAPPAGAPAHNMDAAGAGFLPLNNLAAAFIGTVPHEQRALVKGLHDRELSLRALPILPPPPTPAPTPQLHTPGDNPSGPAANELNDADPPELLELPNEEEAMPLLLAEWEAQKKAAKAAMPPRAEPLPPLNNE